MKKLPRLPSLPPLAPFARNILIGVGVVAVFCGVAFLLNRGSQVNLDGQVLKVRVIPTDENSAVAVVDLRVHNPTGALFQVQEVKLVLVGADGAATDGIKVTQIDLDRLLEYDKMAGPRYTSVLKERDRIRPGAQTDCTVAASFAVADKAVLARRNLRIRIQDSDGQTAEIAERH